MTWQHSTSLNTQRRAGELAELPAVVDLLVVGGGVTGTGVALDAASRGLSVVLAERHDLAFGTSRWSSKLVHGGLRYLASGAVGVARESAVERGILLQRTAPHLVRPFPQLVALLPEIGARQTALLRAGFLAGDALRASAGTGRHTLPRSRAVTRAEVLRLAPPVRPAGLRGGLLNWDGQLQDDARLVVAIARTAAGHGARVLTRCTATQVTGRGAVLRDELTGSEHPLDARAVVNATGVWAGGLAPDVAVRPSRGTHLVFAPDAFPGLTAGLTVPVPGETNRFVFALPSPEGWVYVGLTDVDAPGEPADVAVPDDQEVDFLLDTINAAMREPLSRKDIAGSYAGLRPLLDTAGRTADISRKHAVHTGPDGLITVVGGKLTTYRRMAQDAVDATRLSTAPCRTAQLPLVGAAHPAVLGGVPAPQRLVQRYGTEATAVLAEADGDPSLTAPLAGDIPTTPAELLFALRHEGAIDESDLLDRRTRIGLSPDVRRRALPLVTPYLAQ